MNATMRLKVGFAALVCVIALFSSFLTKVVSSQAQSDGSRQIVLDEFIRARPGNSNGTTQSAVRRSSNLAARRSNSVAKLTHYRRVTAALSMAMNSGRLPASQIGITLWRLRPSRPEDEQGARLLVMKNAEATQWTPERMELETPLKVGDRVRISVEAPRSGYLYVVDREQYSDGSFGDPYIIFPTARTRAGDNRVRPGKLIDIPAQEDTPNHFTLVPNPDRNDQIGEVLTFVLSGQPLPSIHISDKPLRIDPAELTKWEQVWGVPFERFEMEGGMGQVWTKAERDAGAVKSNRLLTMEEPAPQTVYRLAAKSGAPMLVNVHLSYRNHQ
jgi:hypothetical protein